MNEWPDEKIRSTSLRYINKHVMDPSTWRVTIVGEMHPSLSSLVRIKPGEFPIVSAFHSESSWYVLSTRRVLGAYHDEVIDEAVLDVVQHKFGNFKGLGQTTIEIMSLEVSGGRIAELEYETGKASMAPIYYFRYWAVKCPVLNKLTA